MAALGIPRRAIHRAPTPRQSQQATTGATSVPASGNLSLANSFALPAIQVGQVLRVWQYNAGVFSDAGGVGKLIVDSLTLRVTLAGSVATLQFGIPGSPGLTGAQLAGTAVGAAARTSMVTPLIDFFQTDFKEFGLPVTISLGAVLAIHNTDAVSAHNCQLNVAALFQIDQGEFDA